ncbi:MAG: hypothetical protein AAFQ42_14985, partial [Pseudomonadota bacterium]
MKSMAVRALVGAAAVFAVVAATPGAHAQQLSDRSIRTLMGYAFDIMPSKFTTRTNKVIEVDKSKPKEVLVPIDTARAVVQVGQLSALAQICNLPNAQRANFRSLMRIERKNNGWTDKQLLYISQLHFTTLAWFTDQLEVSAIGDQKRVGLKKESKGKKSTCTDTEREK